MRSTREDLWNAGEDIWNAVDLYLFDNKFSSRRVAVLAVEAVIVGYEKKILGLEKTIDDLRAQIDAMKGMK